MAQGRAALSGNTSLIATFSSCLCFITSDAVAKRGGIHYSTVLDDTAPDIFRSKFYELCASCGNFRPVYTDVLKMGDRVASVAICLNMVRSARLPNNASVFKAELHAVTLVMDFVRRNKDSNFIIFSDTVSSL